MVTAWFKIDIIYNIVGLTINSIWGLSNYKKIIARELHEKFWQLKKITTWLIHPKKKKY